MLLLLSMMLLLCDRSVAPNWWSDAVNNKTLSHSHCCCWNVVAVDRKCCAVALNQSHSGGVFQFSGSKKYLNTWILEFITQHYRICYLISIIWTDWLKPQPDVIKVTWIESELTDGRQIAVTIIFCFFQIWRRKRWSGQKSRN